VCLIGLLAVAIGHVVEQSANASQESARTLQKGVSVKMAGANNAQPMPEADYADAWIVTVTADGRVYFGVDAVTPASLRERITRTPHRRGQKLYIKADARASFASVQKALDAASIAEFESPVLLVGQPSPASPGTMVAPKGLEITMDGATNSGAKSVVELNRTPGGSPTVRIDDQEVPFSALHDRLHQLAESKKDKTILFRADGRSAFGDVARVIDACQAAGESVVIAMPVV
jgi:biopolymer transport protein ExbD